MDSIPEDDQDQGESPDNPAEEHDYRGIQLPDMVIRGTGIFRAWDLA